MGNARSKAYMFLCSFALSGIAGFSAAAGIYAYIFLCDLIAILITGNNYINPETEYLFKDFMVIAVVSGLLTFILFANETIGKNKKNSI